MIFICLFILPITLAFISGYFFKKEIEKEYKKRMLSGEICENCKHFSYHWQLCNIHPYDYDITPSCYCNQFKRKEGEK